MKKALLIIIAFITVLSVSAQRKKNEGKSFSQMIEDLKWRTPSRTGFSSIDDMYEKSEDLYKSVKAMGDSVPMYSLRAIVENGDTTAILVVDQNNQPYDSFSATKQIFAGSSYLTSVTANAVGLSTQYVKLVADLPNIVVSNPLKSISIIAAVTKHSKMVGKLAKDFLPQVKEMYESRGNPIKRYNEMQKSLSKEDGFVTTGFDHVPEFSPEDMPSDEDIDRILEQERADRAF